MLRITSNAFGHAFVILFCYFISACGNEAASEHSASDTAVAKEDSTATPKMATANPDTLQPICVAIDPVMDRAAANNKFRWDSGQVVKIYFVNGASALQSKVIAYASEWMKYCSVKFVLVKKLPADITIKFIPGLDNWSQIGTLSKKKMPSMYLGMDAMDYEPYDRSIVLHEFGHALGLIHEHQSPDADIPWNVEAVYRHYRNIGWSTATTNANIFRRYSRSVITNSVYDPLSIMHYPISEDLLTDPAYAVEWNFDLSETDKRFIKNYYNKRKAAPRKEVNDDRGPRGEVQKNMP